MIDDAIYMNACMHVGDDACCMMERRITMMVVVHGGKKNNDEDDDGDGDDDDGKKMMKPCGAHESYLLYFPEFTILNPSLLCPTLCCISIDRSLDLLPISPQFCHARLILRSSSEEDDTVCE